MTDHWADAVTKPPDVSPDCPQCGSPMKRRTSRFGPFWGCTDYPNCRVTINIDEEVEPEPARDLTEEQLTVRNSLAPRVAVIATAGSGKTMTMVEMAVSGTGPFLYCAFNRDAASDANARLARRLGRNATRGPGLDRALTSHSIGWHCAMAGASVTRAKYDGQGPEKVAYKLLQEEVKRLLRVYFVPENGELSRKEWRDARKLVCETADMALAQLKPPLATANGMKDHRAAYAADELLKFARRQQYTAFNMCDLTFEYAVNTLNGGYLSEHFMGCERLFVDEAQDLSPAQWQFVDAFVQAHGVRQLTIVGDDSQCVYEWRAADLDQFLQRCRDANYRTLATNFRCPRGIVEAARDLIEVNTNRLDNPVMAARSEHGDITVVTELEEPLDEAEYVVRLIAREVTKPGGRCADWLVMSRTNAALLTIEDRLLNAKIPYRMLGSRAYDSADIRCLRRFMLGVEGHIEKLGEAVMCLPGIGAFSTERAASHANTVAAFFDALHDQVRGKGKDSARRAENVVDAILELRAKKVRLSAQVRLAVDLYFPSQADADQFNMEDGETAREAATAFMLFCDNFDAMIDVERYIANLGKEGADAVTLSTVHKQKGREAKHVVIIHAMEGVFPHRRCMSPLPVLEAERRLFYVAMTRAQESLTITCPKNSYTGKPGEISRFVGEANLLPLLPVEAEEPSEQPEPPTPPWEQEPII